MTSDLPAPDLAAIRQRTDSATSGPWFVVGPASHPSAPYVSAGSPDPRHGRFIADLDVIPGPTDDGRAPFGSNQANDAEFIAHARTDVDLLLDAVDRLRTLTEGLQARIDAVIALHQPWRSNPNSDPEGPIYCSCGAVEIALTDDGSSIGPVEYPCATLRAVSPLLDCDKQLTR
jgi:hypothetical protein